MEIKPQELRIGNLVDRNGIMEVLGIGANNKLVIYDHYNKERLPYGLDVESFKGIALTPEWLEKFGFVYNGGSGYKAPHNTEHWYFTLRNGFMPNSIARGSIKTDDYIGCKYVHQLQNLYFALTGNELAIDNKSL